MTVEEATYAIAAAGVPIAAPDGDTLPVPRVEICRLLLAWIQEQEAGDEWRVAARWDSPFPRFQMYFEGEWKPSDVANELLGLVSIPGDADRVHTIGGLVLYAEGRLRDLWREDASGCLSQQAFDALRQAARSAEGIRARFSPGARLRKALPPERAEVLRTVLGRRFGIAQTPVSRRVFGVAEIGATWLAIWPLSALVGGLLLVFAGVSPGSAFLSTLIWGAVLGWLLNRVSRTAWDGLRNPRQLVRWCLRERERAKRRVQAKLP